MKMGCELHAGKKQMEMRIGNRASVFGPRS